MSVKYVGMTKYNSIWPKHRHDTWELILNLRGSGVMDIDGTDYKYGPGTVIICPPGTSHTKYSASGFWDIFIQFDNPPSFIKNKVVIFDDSAENTIRTLMYRALRYFNRKANGYKEVLSAILSLVLTVIACDVADKRSNIVRQAENKLIENYIDPSFKLKDLYESISYDEDYVRRCFKKETGITPNTYLNNLRMDNAVRIMERANSSHEKISISELAFMCGFEDALYFSKVFKKRTGVSPREYLKKE